MTLSGVCGFWKYVSNLDRRETKRYLEMFYALKYHNLEGYLHKIVLQTIVERFHGSTSLFFSCEIASGAVGSYSFEWRGCCQWSQVEFAGLELSPVCLGFLYVSCC
ncbi:hypothetical protein KSP40_PGU004592 [Platanthera guangdongensis]|uniref:Sucrose synthase n=1 Tax=Platanthera guangdongensis TaxID=2320717 RepID=A0ABR2LRP1_9ASPA